MSGLILIVIEFAGMSRFFLDEREYACEECAKGVGWVTRKEQTATSRK